MYTEEEVGDIIDAESVTVTESPEALAAKERKRAIAESKMAQPSTETTVTTTVVATPADVATTEPTPPAATTATLEKPETIVITDGKTVLETDPEVNEELAKQVTPELEAAIKEMIKRRFDEGMTNVADLIVGKLKACGYEKIGKLRMAEAQLLHQALVDNNLALFLECSLIRVDELPF